MMMMIKKRSHTAIILFFAFLLLTSAALAASVGEVHLTLIDPSQFPTVTLYLAVSDIDDRPLVGLRPEEVTLFENEVPIEPLTFEAVEHPMLIGVVIDSSGSFAEMDGSLSRLDHAREATRQLIDPAFNRLAIEDEVAIFAFGRGQPIRWLDFTSDHNRAISQGLDQISTEGNNYTTLFDVLRQGIKDIIGREGVRRRALLLFSDGVDETSALTVDQVIQQAVDADLLIYTVGMGPNLAPDEAGSAFLRRLANQTGAQYLWFQPNQSGAEQTLQRFLDQLPQQRQGYALSFQSNEFEHRPEVRVVVQNGGRVSEDTSTYRVPSQPPEVSLNIPEEGAEVSGMITIEPIIVRQQRAIERVEYRVDGQLLHTARATPFSFEWNTERLASAEAQAHNLTITVIDTGGLERLISRDVNVQPMPAREAEAVQVQEQEQVQVQEQEQVQEEEQNSSSSDSNSDNDSTSSSSRGLYTTLGLGLLALLVIGLIIWKRKQDQDQDQKQDQEQDQKQDQEQEQDRQENMGRKPSQSAVETVLVPGSKKKGTEATLVVANGAQRGRQFQISKNPVFLGRDRLQADLAFDWDPRISRRHAKISRFGNQFYIWDLNSGNGTRVNQTHVSPSDGNSISDAHAIVDQATIQLGSELKLTFYSSSGTPKKKPRYHSPTQSNNNF